MIASEQIAQALPWLLALGVLLASVRLLLGLRRLPAAARPHAWRSGCLLLGTCASAALLFLLLRTAEPGDNIRTLHLLTANAPATPLPAPRADERWLRLPEAAPRHDIDRVPDLATALRRHPRVRTLHVIGDGLETRDRDAASGLAIRFERAPLARGIRDWWAPQTVHSGDAVDVRGSVHGGGRIELLDPSGTRVDQQPLQADGTFSLQSTTRSPGLTIYQLRLRDADGKAIASTPVPVQVLPTVATRLLLRSGGPDPDLKFLRRWAADNGASLRATIDLGAGMQAGDPATPLDARSLADVDVLILDERIWNGLGPYRRAAILAAVGDGMGLLLRAAAPLADGGELGLQVRAARVPETFRLPREHGDDAPVPALTRPPLRIDNPTGHTLLRDDRGNPLVAWRARGRGRIALWLPSDSYRVALAGRADLHARLWADALETVSRARARPARRMPPLAFVDERTVLCGLGDAARVGSPGEATPVRLLVDPRSGDARCAAFWPSREGWHHLIDAGQDTPFLVRAATAEPTLRAARTQQATAALADRSPMGGVSPATPAPTRFSHVPLFLSWLALTGALWWFERSRLGRVRDITPG